MLTRSWHVQLILALTTSWGDTGSVSEYVSWSSTAQQQSDFYSDATCMQLYKEFVAQVLGRINTISGRLYKEDPTIFAWHVHHPVNTNLLAARMTTCHAVLQFIVGPCLLVMEACLKLGLMRSVRV